MHAKKLLLFFYNNAIPFNVANDDEFKKMFELVASHGIGLSHHPTMKLESNISNKKLI